MYSNVYFDHRTSEINYWEYENGVKEHKKAPAPLFFYVTRNADENSGYKTLYGENARRMDFDRWRAFKDKRDNFRDMGMELYESDVPAETKFIITHYMGIDLEPPEFDTHYIDIEVHSEEGFPKPEKADFPVTIITIWSTKDETFYIFAEKNFNTDFMTKRGEKFKKYVFQSEEELLKYLKHINC